MGTRVGVFIFGPQRGFFVFSRFDAVHFAGILDAFEPWASASFLDGHAFYGAPARYFYIANALGFADDFTVFIDGVGAFGAFI